MALVKVRLIEPAEAAARPPSDGSARTITAEFSDVWMNPEDVSQVVQQSLPAPTSIIIQQGKSPVVQGSLQVCTLHLVDQQARVPQTSHASRNPLAVGTETDLRLKLGAGPRDLGLRVVLIAGTETTITGTILGPVKLRMGEHLCLDPSYLDDGGEWTIARPTGRNPRYEIQIGPNRAFNLQEKRPAATPGQPDVWRTISSTTQPQAACTLRPLL